LDYVKLEPDVPLCQVYVTLADLQREKRKAEMRQIPTIKRLVDQQNFM
jgi:hypothetical protein